MKVAELIKILSKIKDQDSEITIEITKENSRIAIDEVYQSLNDNYDSNIILRGYK